MELSYAEWFNWTHQGCAGLLLTVWMIGNKVMYACYNKGWHFCAEKDTLRRLMCMLDKRQDMKYERKCYESGIIQICIWCRANLACGIHDYAVCGSDDIFRNENMFLIWKRMLFFHFNVFSLSQLSYSFTSEVIANATVVCPLTLILRVMIWIVCPDLRVKV